MARPNILPAPTKLYSPMEPEGRLFLAGEPWPGDAWSDKPGGDAVGGNAAVGALKDLIEANDRLDQTAQMMASKDHDLAQMAAAKEAAEAQVAELKQRAADAEKAQADAEAVTTEVTRERDQARSDLQRAQAKAEKPAKAEA